jgi:hypothetical protein
MSQHKIKEDTYTVRIDPKDDLVKVYNHKGEVAVLISQGFGAGWYSWNQEYLQSLYSPAYVLWVLGGKPKDEIPSTRAVFGREFYGGGAESLYVEWLSPGTKFRIDEADGAEHLVRLSNEQYLEA